MINTGNVTYICKHAPRIEPIFFENSRDMLLAVAAAAEGNVNLAGRGFNAVSLTRVGKRRICEPLTSAFISCGTLDGLSISRIGERTRARTVRLVARRYFSAPLKVERHRVRDMHPAAEYAHARTFRIRDMKAERE